MPNILPFMEDHGGYGLPGGDNELVELMHDGEVCDPLGLGLFHTGSL